MSDEADDGSPWVAVLNLSLAFSPLEVGNPINLNVSFRELLLYGGKANTGAELPPPSTVGTPFKFGRRLHRLVFVGPRPENDEAPAATSTASACCG